MGLVVHTREARLVRDVFLVVRGRVQTREV
jgi:hypothetical protein